MGRIILLLATVVSAHAQAVKPYLRIETGAHTARVNRIDVDAAERFLVSASDDKTARVWEYADQFPTAQLEGTRHAAQVGSGPPGTRAIEFRKVCRQPHTRGSSAPAGNQRILRWELRRLGSEAPALAPRADAFTQRFLASGS